MGEPLLKMSLDRIAGWARERLTAAPLPAYTPTQKRPGAQQRCAIDNGAIMHFLESQPGYWLGRRRERADHVFDAKRAGNDWLAAIHAAELTVIEKRLRQSMQDPITWRLKGFDGLDFTAPLTLPAGYRMRPGDVHEVSIQAKDENHEW